MVKASIFHHVIKASSSRPLVVSDASGKKYVLKSKGSGDGVMANIVEWIACKLAAEVEIPVVPHILVQIDQKLCDQVDDPEIYDPLQKSIGINFGTEYLENAYPYRDQKIDVQLKNSIFLFDLFLLNIDRTQKNTNLLVDEGVIKSLDFASSLTLRYCVDDSFFNVDSVLKEVRKHPFYADQIDPEPFIKKLMDVSDDTVSAIINEMPEEWINEYFDSFYSVPVKKALIKRLINVKNNAVNLRTSVSVLQTLKLETEEERKKQTDANKKAFGEKYGKL